MEEDIENYSPTVMFCKFDFVKIKINKNHETSSKSNGEPRQKTDNHPWTIISIKTHLIHGYR